MPKIPRDLCGKGLAEILKAHGYEITRQTESHMRLSARHGAIEHHITIPAHAPLKIGTLGNMLRELTVAMSTDRETLLRKLFGNS